MRTLALAVLTLLALPVSAQRERDDVHLRNDCRLAGQVLTTGHPAPRHAWALQVIRRCDDTGPEALALAWASPLDSARALELVGPSKGLRDQRLLEAIMAVAQSPSQPSEVRLAALSVLGSYARPRFLFPQSILRAADTLQIQIPPGVVDFFPTEGSEPLHDPREAVVATLDRLAGADPDPMVRRAAAWMRLWLAPL